MRERMMQKKHEAPKVERFVVITHTPEENSAHGKAKTEELLRLIDEHADDAGTHFMVSWLDDIPKNQAIVDALNKINDGRVHQPVADKGLEEDKRRSNFFEDDNGLVKHVTGLNFADEIDVTSWGEFGDLCANGHVTGFLKKLSGKTRIKKITVAGGGFTNGEVDDAIYGGKKQTPETKRLLKLAAGYAVNGFEKYTPHVEVKWLKG
ncbi:hypothetical protein ACFLQ2_04320 [archaeon]